MSDKMRSVAVDDPINAPRANVSTGLKLWMEVATISYAQPRVQVVPISFNAAQLYTQLKRTEFIAVGRNLCYSLYIQRCLS